MYDEIGTLSFKVSKDAKIRNRYNQVPHLTQLDCFLLMTQNEINPFKPNGICHLINWTSLFMFSGLLYGTFNFYSNSNIKFCEQTVELLILWRLIWVCTVLYVKGR